MSHYFEPITTANIKWQDGEPYSEQFCDIYFSKHHGLAESQYVFIEGNHLIERFKNLKSRQTFCIGELGLGTGLNFLLTAQIFKHYAPKNAKLHYLSCEKHPLKREDLQRACALWPELALEAQALIACYPILTPGFHTLQFSNQITLTLMLGDAKDMYASLLTCGDFHLEKKLRQSFVDAWYFDGFAPSKNEAMWDENLFKILALLSCPQTTFATFSCAKSIKESFKKTGFQYQKRKGFRYKRVMLVGVFEACETSLVKKKTPWAYCPPLTQPPKTAIVIGAGLAGAYCARQLAQRGLKVIVFDKKSKPGLGASGNPQAVLFPNVSAYKAPLTELMLQGFLYAAEIWRPLLKTDVNGDAQGLLQLVGQKEQNPYFLKWLLAYPELGVLLNSKDASEKAHIKVQSDAIFVPKALWLDSNQLCHYLMSHPLIQFRGDMTINDYTYDGLQWQVFDEKADLLLITAGIGSNLKKDKDLIPLKAIRGQMSKINASVESANLKLPICGESHVLPCYENSHYFGASYQLNEKNEETRSDEDVINLERLNALPLEGHFNNEIINRWAGVRAATPNYLPIVGPMPCEADFKKDFLQLAKNKNQFINCEGRYQKGLYVAAGFGSRGLTTIPLCIDALMAMIFSEFSPLPRHLIEAISPARFMIGEIIKNKI